MSYDWRMKFCWRIVVFLFLTTSCYAEDPCQKVFRLSCQDVTVNLDEGSQIKSLSELAAQGREVIPEIKNEMIAVLRRRVVDQKILVGMVSRVQSVQVVITENSDAMSYNHSFHRVNVGMLFFKEINTPFRIHPSLFSFIQAVSHEIAHSIDPCMLQLGLGGTKNLPSLLNLAGMTLDESITVYPIQSLQCLSNSSVSVGLGFGEIDEKSFDSNHPMFGKPLCAALRLNETLSDYLAAEVLNSLIRRKFSHLTQEQLINGLANVYSINCHAKSPPSEGSAMIHPSGSTRLAWIVLKHPGIREALQCGPVQDSKQYCD